MFATLCNHEFRRVQANICRPSTLTTWTKTNHLQGTENPSRVIPMPRRELNNENPTKRMATKFGHSDNLITLSLSLSLRRSPIYTREVVTPFILRAGRPRQYTAFLAFRQGKSACFFVPVGQLRRGR